jgi:ANTAR domain/GAF domain
MAELADTDDEDSDELAYQRLLVLGVAEALAPAEVGWLTTDEAGALSVVAASTERAGDLIRREKEHGGGPTIDCCRTGEATLNRPVAAIAMSWPELSAAAHSAGFTTVSSLPVARPGAKFGALSVLAADGHQLDAAHASLAQALAEFAVTARVRRRQLRRSAQAVRQLQVALDSRVLIEQAKGAVAARLGVSPDEAFELLRGYARRSSRRLREVSGDAIRGDLSAHVLRTSPGMRAAGRHGARQPRLR